MDNYATTKYTQTSTTHLDVHKRTLL